MCIFLLQHIEDVTQVKHSILSLNNFCLTLSAIVFVIPRMYGLDSAIL